MDKGYRPNVALAGNRTESRRADTSTNKVFRTLIVIPRDFSLLSSRIDTAYTTRLRIPFAARNTIKSVKLKNGCSYP